MVDRISTEALVIGYLSLHVTVVEFETWTCCTQNQHLYQLNLLHTKSTPLSTLWTFCTQSQHLYPLSEPVEHKFNAIIHSPNFLPTSRALFSTRQFPDGETQMFIFKTLTSTHVYTWLTYFYYYFLHHYRDVHVFKQINTKSVNKMSSLAQLIG